MRLSTLLADAMLESDEGAKYAPGNPSPVMVSPARKKAALALAEKRVKFGKSERISNLWDDDKAMPVLVDGKEVGEIVAHMVSKSMTQKSVRIGSYSMEPDEWSIDGVDVAVHGTQSSLRGMLDVRKEGKGKEILERAKRFAVQTVANAMIKAGTDKWPITNEQ